MRPAAGRFQRRPVGLGQGQGGAIVDRRQTAGLLAFAPALQLFGRLVAGVESSDAPQFRRRRVIQREPLGLMDD